MARFNIFRKEENNVKNTEEEKLQEKVENLKEAFEEAREESKVQLQEDAENSEKAIKMARKEVIEYTARRSFKNFRRIPRHVSNGLF